MMALGEMTEAVGNVRLLLPLGPCPTYFSPFLFLFFFVYSVLEVMANLYCIIVNPRPGDELRATVT